MHEAELRLQHTLTTLSDAIRAPYPARPCDPDKATPCPGCAVDQRRCGDLVDELVNAAEAMPMVVDDVRAALSATSRAPLAQMADELDLARRRLAIAVHQVLANRPDQREVAHLGWKLGSAFDALCTDVQGVVEARRIVAA